MAQFNISINSSEKYLLAISGLTGITRKETIILASIIDFMIDKNLFSLDDSVRDHIMNKFKINKQTYHNFIYKYRKKKLILNTHSKKALRPMLLPGTTLQIKFEEAPVILEEYNVKE